MQLNKQYNVLNASLLIFFWNLSGGIIGSWISHTTGFTWSQIFFF